MKIHITLDDPAREGYFWASPKNILFDGDYTRLDKYCYIGQCEEIYAPGFLDYLEYEKIPDVISSWVNILKRGGKLIIGGIDSYIMAKLYISRNIPINKLNNIYFGRELLVKSFNSVEDIKGLLFEANMTIDTISLNAIDPQFVIEAHK